MPFETDKSGGFKIDASELLKTGVYPEKFDRQIPFWETVNGVQYTEQELFGPNPTSPYAPLTKQNIIKLMNNDTAFIHIVFKKKCALNLNFLKDKVVYLTRRW